jgi:hypothetical protein
MDLGHLRLARDIPTGEGRVRTCCERDRRGRKEKTNQRKRSSNLRSRITLKTMTAMKGGALREREGQSLEGKREDEGKETHSAMA